MRRLTLAWLALMLPVSATAGPADLPSCQYFYSAPGTDAIWSVACSPAATILAASLGTLSVLSYSSDGDPLGGWSLGAAPEFVAAADDGTVWASSSSRGDVRSYTPAGSELVTIPGTYGALATAPGGDVFVGTTTSVRRYRADGAFVHEWPYCYTPNGCIGVHVRGLAVGADTTVYVALDDGGLEEVAWFRPAGGGGTLSWPYPYPGRSPRGVALDPASGELYVSFQDPVASAAGVVKYSAARDTVGTAWLPGTAMVLGGITVDHAGHLHVPTSLGVARFGLGTDPAHRTSWGAVKRLGR